MNPNKKTLLVLLAALAPLLYLAMIWKNIPALVPLHFSGNELKVDRTGSKNELWIASGILAAVSIGMFFLLQNLHHIDPRRKGAGRSLSLTRLAVGLVVFMALLNVLLVESSVRGPQILRMFLFPLLALLLAFIGNNIIALKPNYFAGIRLPWTLSNDDNWRRTHQLAGKLWFAGGLLLAVCSQLLPFTALLPLFIGTVLVLVLVPCIYSYRLFKSK